MINNSIPPHSNDYHNRPGSDLLTLGYKHEFWKTSGHSLKCALHLADSASCSKVPSNLSRTSWKAQIFSRLITGFAVLNGAPQVETNKVRFIHIHIETWKGKYWNSQKTFCRISYWCGRHVYTMLHFDQFSIPWSTIVYHPTVTTTITGLVPTS